MRRYFRHRLAVNSGGLLPACSKPASHSAGPELTRSAGIKLNARVSLRRHLCALSLPHRTISPEVRATVATPPGDHIPLGDLSSVRVLGHGSGIPRQRFDSVLSPGASEQMKAIQSSDGQHRPARRPRFVYVIYLLAVAVATLGWMWFIVWIAMQFF
jgi:hypothetical protein